MNNIRRPTKIMQQAVNLEFEGKTVEALRLLEEHQDESDMHSPEYLMQFFESRRDKGLGPYSLNGTSHGKTRRAGRREPASRRQTVAAQIRNLRKSDEILDLIGERTSTVTLLQIQERVKELLASRGRPELEKAEAALRKVARLRDELREAMRVLETY